MKHHLKKTIVLSPLEVGKDIHIHTDASSQGLGFILSQPHKDEEKKGNTDHYRMKQNIITLGSAGLTSTQERYSSGEQECLVVLHAIQKTDFYVRCAQKIVVFSDNKNLCDFFKMPLHDIKNEHILKFREKLLGYPLEFEHVKGSTHSVADRLSCYPEKENTCLDLEDRFTPSVASKSLRTKESGKNPTDPHINKIARIAKDAEYYKYTIECIKTKSQLCEQRAKTDPAPV